MKKIKNGKGYKGNPNKKYDEKENQ